MNDISEDGIGLADVNPCSVAPVDLFKKAACELAAEGIRPSRKGVFELFGLDPKVNLPRDIEVELRKTILDLRKKMA